MANSLFQFRLRPIAEVVPWGSAGALNLHWFGLTDGWYWLRVGDQEIFRARDEGEGEPWYLDYHVVRLWRDVLELLPAVLAPVPDDVGRRLVDDGIAWLVRARRVLEADDVDDGTYDRLECGTRWAGDRWLDTGYLVSGPRVLVWRMRDVVHIAWDNRALFDDDGAAVWSASAGHVTMPVQDFIAEVRDFDARLLTAMAARIEIIRSGWTRPDVHIDVAELDRAQAENATWLPRALSRVPDPVDWDAVRDALREIDTRMAR